MPLSIYLEKDHVSTLGTLLVCTFRAMDQPSDCDIEKSASCIGEEVVKVRITSRNERLVVFVQQTIHNAEDESAEEGAIPQHQEACLIVECASCQPAKDEVDESVDNFVRARRQLEVELGTGNSREKIDNDHP